MRLRLTVVFFLLSYSLSTCYAQGVMQAREGFDIKNDSTIVFDDEHIIVSYVTVTNEYPTIAKFKVTDMAFYDSLNNELYCLPEFENLSQKRIMDNSNFVDYIRSDTIILWPDSVVKCMCVFSTAHTITKGGKEITVKADTHDVKWLKLFFPPGITRRVAVKHRRNRSR